MVQKLLKISTVKVTEVLQSALIENANQRKAVIGAEAILIALIDQKDSVVIKIFNELSLDPAEIRNEIVDYSLSDQIDNPQFNPSHFSQIRMTKDVELLFEAADRERKRLGDSFISTGTLFLACFSDTVKKTREILAKANLDYQACADALEILRAGQKITDREEESKSSALAEYTTDLTLMARKGLLDPVVGRDFEIERVIQILSRRKKNNPLLLGEPGVGKTVIAEGLANRIAQADVPEYLLNKRVLSFEISTLLAGAKMQGEFEERLKTVRDEVIASDGQIILFIDEIHTVVGAGRSSGALDASNMLKPALAKGQLQCIGATTNKEYKQYIEADKALERRFQSVRIEEPSLEQTVVILKGLQNKYENHHHVKYTDASIQAAAELSQKYIQGRSLPDKAIDLLDEAGAIKRLKVIYHPPELREIERKRQQLIEKKSQAFNEQDFEKMAHFQMELVSLDDEFEQKRKDFFDKPENQDHFVDEENIAELVSTQTGIPVSKMIKSEAEKLLQLEEHISKRVIGQRHAISAVANAIRRNRAGLRKSEAPIASFLFLGPTGVGKTELAKAIASEILDDESSVIRLDMSEYMERHDVSKLIGSPPGYVGYGEGGQLTEKIKKQPYSVVLFDEFEKAHPDVFNLLLQILDEGWLTDSEGQKVSFSNAIIIGTSNLGSEVMSDRKKPIGIASQINDWSKDEEIREVMHIVKRFLRPEFINRLDEVIVFNRLSREDFSLILESNISSMRRRLGQIGYTMEITDEAKSFIVESIDTTNYGARPLKRKLDELVENKVANIIISNTQESSEKKIRIGVIDRKLEVSSE